VLHEGPSERTDQWTPWILALLGTLVVGVMMYAWWTAPTVIGH
jgi:hypothetical protein